MRKWWLSLIVMLALLTAPLNVVSARAGGMGMHGVGHMGGARTHMTMGRRWIVGRRLYLGAPGAALFLVVIGWAVAKRLRTRRPEKMTVEATYPIDRQLAEAFDQLFYAVEKAWTEDDRTTLQALMTPRCYRKQTRLLARWAKQGKRNQLTDLSIVSTQLGEGDADHPRVVVTAQGRDYFVYPKKDAAFNARQRDNAMLKRFTEVWTLAYDDDGELRVAAINQ